MNYPRILLIHMTKVHLDDPSNLLIRTLFGDWPKDKIAQIFSGCYSGKGDFCGRYYEIGSDERRLGRIFGLLKPVGVGAMSGHSDDRGMKPHAPLIKKLLTKVASAVVGSGLYEVIFRVRSTPRLNKFVQEFKPDIIYTQGYNLGFTKLALKLAEIYAVPICYFPVDDWHSCLYNKSPIHREVDRLAREIAVKSTLRFALGPKMTETLEQRYGVAFNCIYHADDAARFVRMSSKSRSTKIVFGFTGSLYLGRGSCIADLLHACRSVCDEDFLIRVYCSAVPQDIGPELLNSKQVEFLSLPCHDELPQVLADCDFLFLPESFDKVYREAIELSLSTKCHLYMFSGRPILVYGPSWSGTVNYARRFEWAVVVDESDIESLIRGVRMATSHVIAEDVAAKASNVAQTNHQSVLLRKRVLELMISASQEHVKCN